VLGGGGQEIAQFFGRERFLGGKQNGFQDQFQFHVQAVTGWAGARVISISPKSSGWVQTSCLSRINSSSAKKGADHFGTAAGAGKQIRKLHHAPLRRQLEQVFDFFRSLTTGPQKSRASLRAGRFV